MELSSSRVELRPATLLWKPLVYPNESKYVPRLDGLTVMSAFAIRRQGECETVGIVSLGRIQVEPARIVRGVINCVGAACTASL